MLPNNAEGFWPTMLSNLGSTASFLGLYFTLRPFDADRSPVEWALLTAAVLLALIGAAYAIYNRVRNAPHRCRDQAEVKKFMSDWVSTPGRVSVFSRDMSWANDPEIVRVLEKKAESAELIVHLAADTALTERLRKLGATIFCYGNAGYVPSSRFTIVRYGQHDASVAIGTTSDIHTIYRFRNGHPLFALARDLTEFVQRHRA